jgi:hypothetical protein
VLNLLSACAVISRDTTVAAPARKTIIDFGAANCLCLDGKNRRGKIIINSSKQFWIAGVTHTISFDNFFVNDNQISGTHTTTYNGKNSANNYNWTITEALTLTLSTANGGGNITRNSTRQREMTAGGATLFNWTDDQYTITGSASGINRHGNTYSAAIILPIVVKAGCHHIISGSIDYTPANRPTRTVDWGTGACDNQATVTVNGVTTTITL